MRSIWKSRPAGVVALRGLWLICLAAIAVISLALVTSTASATQCGSATPGITLTPQAAENLLGQMHTVTATVVDPDGCPADLEVTFNVIAGPNAGSSVTAWTDLAGQATFSYTGMVAGTDQIQAGYRKPPSQECDGPAPTEQLDVNPCESQTVLSNVVTKTWKADHPPAAAPPAPAPIPIDSLGPNAQVSGRFSRCSNTSVAVLARISDASGVQEVRFYVDGKLVKTDRQAAFSAKLKVSRLSAGSHTLKMVAVDTKGNTTTIKRKFKRCARVTRHIQPRLTG